jgi:signal transduction histidine kinase
MTQSWQLAQVIGNLPVLTFVVDRAEKLVLLSGGLSQQLGLDPQSVLGQPAFRLSAMPVKKTHFRKALKGESFAITLSIGGSSYETHLNPLRENGEIIGVSGLTVDMTKHLALEQYLDEERHRLMASQRLNSLAGIASGLAHEINNPLAIISGYAEQLFAQAEKGSLTNDRLIFTTRKLIEACERCHRIIEGLKTFARDGSSDPFELCSVNDWVQSTLFLLQERLQAAGIQMIFKPLLQDIQIEGRRLQLTQSLFNLLVNACEAAMQNIAPLVTIEPEDRGGDIKLKIKDNGPGIPESLHVRIFEPFFTTKDQSRSVGMGLSTAKGMIEQHHGSIEFTSQPGTTCFTIVLPKKQSGLRESA